MSDMKKLEAKELRQSLGKALQLEYKNHKWLAHVDQKSMKDKFGVEVDSHIISKDRAIELFNEISDKNGVPVLRDPSGYMALDGNIQTYIKNSYEDAYEGALDDIDANLLDGTGFGIEHTLSKLDSTVRNDVREYMPEGMQYGDLRFVEVTGERREAVDRFVRARLSMTLTYELKRSFEKESIERTSEQFKDAGSALRFALSDVKDNSLEL